MSLLFKSSKCIFKNFSSNSVSVRTLGSKPGQKFQQTRIGIIGAPLDRGQVIIQHIKEKNKTPITYLKHKFQIFKFLNSQKVELKMVQGRAENLDSCRC